MSLDTLQSTVYNRTIMKERQWVPFIVALAAAQAVWLSMKFRHGDRQQHLFSDIYGCNETMEKIQEEHSTINQRDPYLPLESVMAQPKSWEEPILSQSPLQPLNFLHIPKTGGTSIVVAAANAGYAWSDCMFPLRRETKNCPEHPVNNNTAYDPQLWSHHHPHVGSWWHVPIPNLPRNRPNPYAHQDLFVVIRNPYKRILSQYYYRCLRDAGAMCFVDATGHKIDDTPERMNELVQTMVRQQEQSKRASRDYFYHDAHWVPQSHYVYDYVTANKGNSTKKRLVRHVLYFEYLEEQFEALLKAYKLDDIQLSSHKVNDRAEFETYTTVADLTEESLHLIEKVYKDDFELGGYPMLSQSMR
jgi:hypothetical protein